MSFEFSVRRVDADVDRGVFKQRRELPEHPAAVLVSISCGGMLGALARHGLNVVIPHGPDGMPWNTLSINASAAPTCC
ncbi:hypothetical protein GCM10009854_40650 [Saccharopolyspora halophila]|uniref:Uncharacterized protein n=1 Tax=Saccharopolyspora halophila TaxID=405551 RepID=A0ABP5TP73_9PSEU